LWRCALPGYARGSNPFARSRIFMKMLISLLLFAMQPSAVAPTPAAVTTTSGLRFEVLQPGAGRRPQAGDAVLVTYEGRLADGTVFDAPAQPVGLLVSDLVPGFTEALLLMNEGGRYRFRIPAQLAYGAAGVPGVIPPDAELDFTLTLIRIGRPAAP
jgi:FKBP-type peptidyl-prolyl cis-trans isomerase